MYDMADSTGPLPGTPDIKKSGCSQFWFRF